MPPKIKDQIIVLTGASSGFGREAALLFGQGGAGVVLAARDEIALKEVAGRIEHAGGKALVVPTDVAESSQVERLAAAAVERFGRIDTWINNAGIGIGGKIEDVDVKELDRLVQVNLMGQIYGVKAALPIFKRQKHGAFINVGSVAGVRTFPFQTTYCATKHAVKAFTEGLRLELEREPGDYHVTYIAPAAINTPFFPSARSKFGDKQLNAPPPVYDPEVVAQSIVFAAEHPRRDIFVGGFGKVLDILQRISPPLVDRMMMAGDKAYKDSVSDLPVRGSDNLFTPPESPRGVRGPHPDEAKSTSYYTRIFEWHPALKPIALGVAALGLVTLIGGGSRAIASRSKNNPSWGKP